MRKNINHWSLRCWSLPGIFRMTMKGTNEMPSNLKQDPLEYPGKTALIKELPCICGGLWDVESCGGSDPAHFTTGSYAGFNRKNDRRILPLCRVHHTIQGNKGEKSFWFPRMDEARELADFLHILYLEAVLFEKDFAKEMYDACEAFAMGWGRL